MLSIKDFLNKVKDHMLDLDENLNVGGIELSRDDIVFLKSMLKKTKPKKIVEVGVSSGGSSALILNFSEDIKGRKLYAIDRFKEHYKIKGKDTGFLMKDLFSEYKKDYTLYSGKEISTYLDKIGKGIDLAFIDTVHWHPGELLNLLAIIPYMKKNSWIIFHDTSFFMRGNTDGSGLATKYLMDIWRGKKLYSKSTSECFWGQPNIGAIKVENIKENIELLFSLLKTTWEYLPLTEDMNILRKHYTKHYPDHMKTFEVALNFNIDTLERENQKTLDSKKLRSKESESLKSLLKHTRVYFRALAKRLFRRSSR